MIRTALLLVRDLLHFVALTCASHTSLAAENLFLRKQLAFYIERNVRPRRLDDAARIALVMLARVIDWRQLLTVVRPDTLVRWHRQSFRLFWRRTSRRPGRPRIPPSLQDLIATMARANQTWGEERIAAELLLKLGVSVSPRTVRRYMRRPVPSRPRSSSQTWRTFVRNHARETLACHFFVVVTATFRVVYVFLMVNIGTRRILHWNVTEHPTAEWTVQQFRSVLTAEEPYQVIVHDRDAVFSPAVDDALRSMNRRVLNTPVRVPQANTFRERLIGTARRECLDHVIPLHERHLRKVLVEWVPHYNRGRPHASLGPGIPEPPTPTVARSVGHHIPRGRRVATTPILAGLHHERTGLNRSPREFLRSTPIRPDPNATGAFDPLPGAPGHGGRPDDPISLRRHGRAQTALARRIHTRAGATSRPSHCNQLLLTATKSRSRTSRRTRACHFALTIRIRATRTPPAL
jgi:putative transposase